MSGNLFVFGYGSLIWKASFPYIQRQPGYIKSFARRFAQSSTDHRGTVDYPGRVTTIIHSDEWEQFAKSHPSGSQDTFPEDDQVWGVVYEIDQKHSKPVKEYLDYREKNGYSEERVNVYGLVDGIEKVKFNDVLMYVGKLDNPSFVGPENLDDLALRIYKSKGPSGQNKEYLYELSNHIRLLCPESTDHYLETLANKVRQIEYKHAFSNINFKSNSISTSIYTHSNNFNQPQRQQA